MARGQRGRRRIDADGAWKRVLSEMLGEFVAFTLPDFHAAIDWRREPVFLEQELRPVLRRAALGRRVVDLVVQIWLHDGETTWLLVHVEVQGRAEPDFSERMFAYAALLYLRFRARRSRQHEPSSPLPSGLVGIAVLADTNPAWQPGPYGWGWGEYGVQYRYRTLKLADWRDRAAALALADDDRPLAWVVRTALGCKRPGARKMPKWPCGGISFGKCSSRGARGGWMRSRRSRFTLSSMHWAASRTP